VKTLALLLMLLGGAAAVSAAERTVTLDVKDAELRPVLKAMQKQCGIKNLVIDPDVQGSGVTLKFREVPCATAFRIVFRQFGLTGQVEPNLTTVETQKR
jgi:type II secretory pathway component GspD/PulD (secretin)